MALEVIRLLIVAGQKPNIVKVTITVSEEVADYLNNRKRSEIARLESFGKMSVKIVSVKGAPPEYLLFECRDNEDHEIKMTR